MELLLNSILNDLEKNMILPFIPEVLIWFMYTAQESVLSTQILELQSRII